MQVVKHPFICLVNLRVWDLRRRRRRRKKIKTKFRREKKTRVNSIGKLWERQHFYANNFIFINNIGENCMGSCSLVASNTYQCAYSNSNSISISGEMGKTTEKKNMSWDATQHFLLSYPLFLLNFYNVSAYVCLVKQVEATHTICRWNCDRPKKKQTHHHQKLYEVNAFVEISICLILILILLSK